MSDRQRPSRPPGWTAPNSDIVSGLEPHTVEAGQWAYILAVAMRGTAPGERRRSMPWCWEREFQRFFETDDGLARGADVQMEVHKVRAEFAEWCVENAPKRCRPLNETEASNTLRAMRLVRGVTDPDEVNKSAAETWPGRDVRAATVKALRELWLEEQEFRAKRRAKRRRVTARRIERRIAAQAMGELPRSASPGSS